MNLRAALGAAENAVRELDGMHNFMSLEFEIPLGMAQAMAMQAKMLMPIAIKARLTGDSITSAVVMAGLERSWEIIGESAGMPEQRVLKALDYACERVMLSLRSAMVAAKGEGE